MTSEDQVPDNRNTKTVINNSFPYGILIWFCIFMLSLIPLGLKHGTEPPLATSIPMNTQAVEVLKEMGVKIEITQDMLKSPAQLVFIISSVDTSSSSQKLFRTFYKHFIFAVLGTLYDYPVAQAISYEITNSNKSLWTLFRYPGEGLFNMADNDICLLLGTSNNKYYAGFIDGVIFMDFLDAYERKYKEFYWHACSGGKNDFAGYLDSSYSLKRTPFRDFRTLGAILSNSTSITASAQNLLNQLDSSASREASTRNSLDLLNSIAAVKGMAIFTGIFAWAMMIGMAARRAFSSRRS